MMDIAFPVTTREILVLLLFVVIRGVQALWLTRVIGHDAGQLYCLELANAYYRQPPN